LKQIIAIDINRLQYFSKIITGYNLKIKEGIRKPRRGWITCGYLRNLFRFNKNEPVPIKVNLFERQVDKFLLSEEIFDMDLVVRRFQLVDLFEKEPFLPIL